MTVRKKTWTTSSGEKRSSWFVDITYTHPNGERERIRKVAPGNSKRDAEKYERQLIASLVQGTYDTHDPTEVPLFEDFAEEWFVDYVQVNNKPATQRSRRSSLRAHLKPYFGGKRLNEITRRDLARFKRKLLGKGLAKKTVNNHLGILSSMMNTAVDWAVLESAPKIKWLKTPESEWDFLDFDEADRLVAAAKATTEHYAMIATALKTGMRLGELCALRWQDIDLVRGQIRVCRQANRRTVSTPKSNRRRDIDIPRELVELLKEHRKVTKLRGNLVFSSPEGEMLCRDNVKRDLPRACRKAGLREVGWHALRHTYASHLTMLGVPLKMVQELLGHATMEMTMRYAHLAPDVKKQAVQLLDSRNVYDGKAKAQ